MASFLRGSKNELRKQGKETGIWFLWQVDSGAEVSGHR